MMNADSEHGHKLHGENLVLGYAENEAIIDGETVRIPAGNITAIVGPNGSGKSTLLKGLARQLHPRDGRVLLDGQLLGDFSSKERARKLGLLSQENTSPGQLEVRDLVYYGRYPHRGFFEGVTETDVKKVERAISLTGIEDLRDRTLDSLSGGQKQLAWITMILAQDTDILLLDEPTTFLDLHHQLKVMDVVARLNETRDVTIVIVLHDINQAARHADYMIALTDGEIYDSGRPAQLLSEELLATVFEIEATITTDPISDGPLVHAKSPR
ncbi:ABC-type cobalamin/Fe3+-siderophores transport system, ATPase component [Halanaeroarchaeum sp. HSR-CO]|uniref:ABC transporter ATP-binding protein n=1 Tax=Halanaeroarchaeum sp. HSR-CO TaxID=2866382 RepID=UPI00217CD873|nr:ABC transporter ATP-binding protein [Halanaeroarchaeum sp. HSR-CO]UWG48508.1 ABC-type cobalamin/Fe3+-siderophores transport system, ATPase component [Halanaeroarchaeum sp. HSR-CO]